MKNIKERDSESDEYIVNTGLIIVSIVIISAVFSWVCYKKLTY